MNFRGPAAPQTPAEAQSLAAFGLVVDPARLVASVAWGALAICLLFPPSFAMLIATQILVACVWYSSVRRTADLLNPTAVGLALVTIQFTTALPLFLQTSLLPPLYSLMGFYRWNDALSAYWIVSLFVSGFTAFEVFAAGRPRGDGRHPHRAPRAALYEQVGLLGVAGGVICLLTFVGVNFGVGTLFSGAVRELRHQVTPGTGFLFYLATITMPASLLYAYGALHRGRSFLVAAAPALICLVIWSAMGGRARALAHLAAVALLLWNEVRGRRLKAADALVLPGLVGFTVAYFSLVAAFRSVGGAWDVASYLRHGLLADVSALPSIYGAFRAGAGSLGLPALSEMLWPLSEILRLPGRSVGIFFAEYLDLLQPGKPKWGFHGTLAGAAYVGYGPWCTLVMGGVFGAVVNRLYGAFRSGLHPVLFIVAFIYLFRVLFEGPDKWSELVCNVIYTLALLTFVELAPKRGLQRMPLEPPRR